MLQNWLIVGASRGIGLEFSRQLLQRGNRVIATERSYTSKLRILKDSHHGHNLTILNCDVSNETSIKAFVEVIGTLLNVGGALESKVIDTVVLNAGVLGYPNRISELSFQSFQHHLTTNTIGPLCIASSLLAISSLVIKTVVFISSDSGSTTNFLSHEDGFGAYSASKAALNQGLRHLSCELERKRKKGERSSQTVILAVHPGEVNTDMAANVALDWEVNGSIEVEESIKACLDVIKNKGFGGVDQQEGEATFWTWDGRQYPW